MADLQFHGDIPSSKSIFNRALIVQSYFPELTLKGFSTCDDVRHMREGLKALKRQTRVNCGEGGTTFRFMALRASRFPGHHILEASPRLMERPQEGLIDILRQLGVRAEIQGQEMHIFSEGWIRPQSPLRVDTSESSQYASALILNCWLLDFDVAFELVGSRVSQSYFQMTLEMVKSLGMTVRETAKGHLIPAGQRIQRQAWTVEADISSVFTMATAGALAGEVVITNFPEESSQPDKVFLDIFKRMNVNFSLEGKRLAVKKGGLLKPLNWNLSQCPDLFPVLAVLCSWAPGVSKLDGAPHLAKKESNRIEKVSDLLNLIGIPHEALLDGMVIHGNPHQSLVRGKSFHPDKDHRMVMAAALMKLKGHDIRIEESHVINKSFPEFWSMIGVEG